MDDQYIIDTPENIEFAYDIAGIGSRFLAAIIDSLLIGIALSIVNIAGSIFGNSSFLDSGPGQRNILVAISILLNFIIFWSYYIVFEMVWSGQSPGKRIIGLRVVRSRGQPITFASSAIRNLVRLVDFMPSFYGIGVVAMFIDRRVRRLGDLAAGTLVVKERREVTLESLTTAVTAPVLTTPSDSPGDTPQTTLPNLHLLTDQDYNLAQEFLRRRSELSLDARVRLAKQLASGLQARLGVPQGGDSERFLQYVVNEYQLFQQQQAI